MALDWKTKTITLAKGMRDDVDQFQLEPPNTALIRNGIFEKDGVISKRPGLGTHTATAANTGNPTQLIPTEPGYLVVGDEAIYSTDGAYSEIDSPTYATKKYSEYVSRSGPGVHSFHYSTSGSATVCSWIETLTASSGATAGEQGALEQLEAGVLHIRVQFPSGKILETSISGYVAAQTHYVPGLNEFHIVALNALKSSVASFRYSLSTEASSGNFTTPMSYVADCEHGNAGTTTQLAFSFDSKKKFQSHVNESELYVAITYDNVGTPTVRLLRLDSQVGTLVNSVDFLADANVLHMTADSNQLMLLTARTATNAITASRITFGGVTAFNTATITIGSGETVIRGAWYSNDTDQCVVYTSKEEVIDANGVNSESAAHTQDVSYFTVKTVAEYDSGITGTFSTEKTYQQEQLVSEPIIYSGKAVFAIAPFIQHPFLNYAGNVEETYAKTLPILYKPTTAVIVDTEEKVFGLLAQNEGHCYDYIKQGSADELIPTYLVSGNYYFGCRKIVASGSDVGRFTDLSGSKNDKVRVVSFAECRFEINRLTVSEGRGITDADRFYTLTGGAQSLISGSEINLNCVPNAPELVGVESLNVFPSANPAELPSCGYSTFEATQTSPPTPDFTYFIQGISLVISKGIGEGIVRSAPSETVWVPLKIENSSLTEFAMTNFRFLFYAPDILGSDYKVEVYAFIAQDDSEEFAVGGTPKLVGTYPLSKASFKNVTGPTGYNYIDVNLSLDNTQTYLNGKGVNPRTVSEAATQTLYTDTEVAADVIPSFQLVTKGADRVFGVDDNYAYYSKPLYSNTVPEFNALFRVNTTRSRPKAIQALDDKIVIFYADGISVLVGSGVDASGVGPGYFIQDMPGSVGVLDPESVIRVDPGIIFRSDSGFYLLDRGLNLKPIRGLFRYLLGVSISAAIDYKKAHTIVFSLADTGTNLVEDGPNYSSTAGRPPVPLYGYGYTAGEALAYNYRTDDWSILTNHDFASMVYKNEKLAGVRSDWSIMEYGDGFDDDDTTSGSRENLLKIVSPWIKFTNMQDYAALRRITVLGRYYSELYDDGSGDQDAGDVNVLVRNDYENDPNETATIIERWTPSEIDPSPERMQIQLRPSRRKCQSVQVEIYETPTSGNYRTGRGFEVSSVDFQVGLKGGPSRVRKERKK